MGYKFINLKFERFDQKDLDTFAGGLNSTYGAIISYKLIGKSTYQFKVDLNRINNLDKFYAEFSAHMKKVPGVIVSNLDAVEGQWLE
jgi:hypothetical protein